MKRPCGLWGGRYSLRPAGRERGGLFGTDLHDAHAKGYLARRMHPGSVSAYLDSDLMTPVLESLIVRSSLPLRAVDVDFAVDSTWFGTSRFVRWYDHKYGCPRQ